MPCVWAYRMGLPRRHWLRAPTNRPVSYVVTFGPTSQGSNGVKMKRTRVQNPCRDEGVRRGAKRGINWFWTHAATVISFYVRPSRIVGRYRDEEVGTGSDMFQVRFHGRGGQGVVTAAEMLSMAAFDEGRFSQAFPSFGSERTGAPVVSFCRIDDRPIRSREPVIEPDALVIQDATLIHQVDLFAGLSREGYVLINTSKSFDELGLGDFLSTFHRERLLTCPATELALEHLGRPLPNAVLLGGFAALTAQVTLDSIAAAINERFKGATAERNVAAATAAYQLVKREEEELARASTN